MPCISPLSIRKDGRHDVVPCGKCNYCLQSKRADWSFRLYQELKICETAYFLTLTYEDEKIPTLNGIPTLQKTDLQLFTKRLRKENALVTDWPVRYYSVGEYGTRTLRPHYHSLMFNLAPMIANRLDGIWGKGHCHVGSVSPASIHYVTKYVINRHNDYSGLDPPFAHMSRRPGIGAHYLKSHKQWHLSEMRNYTQVHGIKTKLPRYYKEKIFDRLQRKMLAATSVDESDRAYLDQVENLSRFHTDPYAYYDERLRATHDRITSKVNISNTF